MTKTELAFLSAYLAFLSAIALGTLCLACLHWDTVTADKSGILGGAIALGVGIPLVAIAAAFRDIRASD